MNNIKTIVLLCFIYCIATVDLMDNSRSFFKSLFDRRTSKIEHIARWTNSLKPAKVVKWHYLFPIMSSYYYRDYLKKVLAITGCPSHIIKKLAEKYTESNWPPGIENFMKREENMEFLKLYKCRRLPSTTISREIVVVLASDNKLMSLEMTDELGFVLFFSKGGTADEIEIAVEIATDTPEVDKIEIDKPEIEETVHIMNNAIIETDEIKKWSKSLKPANVVDWRRLYTNLSDFFYMDYLKKVLAITGCPTHIINNLAEKYTESNWPPAIMSFLDREFGKEFMNSYICRRLPGTTISKEIVVVLASDNKTMPEDMINEIGFVMFFNKGGTEDKDVEIATDKTEVDETVYSLNDVFVDIDTSELNEIVKWSNSMKPVKVVNWDVLSFNLNSQEDYLVARNLVTNGCPRHIVKDLAEKNNNNHWPPGMSTEMSMRKNMSLMNSYICKRLPSTLISKEIVVVLACDNRTMPKEMIDEIGFVMIIAKEGIDDKEDIVSID